MRLSGYEEIRCFKFNSVSYNQEMTEGNYVYTSKLDQSNKSFFASKNVYFLVPFYEKKKKKKKLFHRGNGWTILWLYQINDHAGHLTAKIAFLYNTYVPMNA